MIRPLLIDDEAHSKIAKVLKYAEDYPYDPDIHKTPPDDNEKYVCELGTYRCVFTYTHLEGNVSRHLSISVPGTKYPNVAAILMIATEFGFTGWDQKNFHELPENWTGLVDKKYRCAIIVQGI